MHAAGYHDEPLIHAMKKILFAGKRGKKSKRQDIEEAKQSLERWLERNGQKSPSYSEDLYANMDFSNEAQKEAINDNFRKNLRESIGLQKEIETLKQRYRDLVNWSPNTLC